MTQRVFITGGSGCVGHYIVESLLHNTDWHLYLLLRNPQKLKVNYSSDRLTILRGDLQNIEQFRSIIAQMDYLVSTAACWGGENTYLINVEKNHALFSYLDTQVCKRAIYFSTASILDQHKNLLPEAEAIGTDYIRSKYLCLKELESLPIAQKLITVFPTIVFGGNGRDKPFSFISAGLQEVLRYVPYIRWLKTEGSFHFIHAFDIAQIVTKLLVDGYDNGNPPVRLVIGMPKMSVNQAIAEVCAFTKHPIWWQIEVTPALINLVRWLFRLQMAEWDQFCLRQRHFVYDHITPEDLGLTAKYPRLANILSDV